ncbi:CAF17-like 4Fe-4S cluster assembly/insertion protein YgfZ [Thiohalorhabdus sp.]|uniref:CAF17-like 4Fe-4S cluster assembly/insertion protein YgfZ n=1 Tax=Thiohalorhabdus sp. TaxID=3094134 RepID=UPI002FC36768
MFPQWQSTLESFGGQFQDGVVTDFGDPRSELAAAEHGETIVTDLSHRTLLTLTGTEVLSFLQGQVTNDVYPAEHGTPVLGAHLTPKGRVIEALLLFPFEDGFAVDLPGDLAQPLTKRLTMFILHADVRLTNASGDWVRLGVAGKGARDAAAAAVSTSNLVPEGVTRGERGTAVPLPGPEPAYLVAVGPEEAGEAWKAAAATARAVGKEAWELARVRAGVPDIGAATTETFIPQETNLEPLGGISYTKGCYTGQEVVARTKHLGRLKRRLYRVSSETPLTPGQAVYAEDAEQTQGRVIRAAPRAEGGSEALTVLRIETVEAGTPLVPECSEAPLQIEDLPYRVPEVAD